MWVVYLCTTRYCDLEPGVCGPYPPLTDCLSVCLLAQDYNPGETERAEQAAGGDLTEAGGRRWWGWNKEGGRWQ